MMHDNITDPAMKTDNLPSELSKRSNNRTCPCVCIMFKHYWSDRHTTVKGHCVCFVPNLLNGMQTAVFSGLCWFACFLMSLACADYNTYCPQCVPDFVLQQQRVHLHMLLNEAGSSFYRISLKLAILSNKKAQVSFSSWHLKCLYAH